MTRNDDLHSTEKLLQIIRHKDSQRTVNPGMIKTKANLIRPLRLTRRRTIGVDIGHTGIKMAKVERLSDAHYELTDFLDIPLNRPISLQDPELVELLKSNLKRLCGQDGSCRIWSAIPASNVETRCIRIPKLPRKQVRNAVLWTFTQKIAFNAQQELFDYEILGEISDGGVKKTEVMAVKAPKSEIEALQAAFEKAGYPLKGISISAFAIQNLFRRQLIPHRDQELCSLFIGRDWSRIVIFKNGNLVLLRGIKAGIRSMIESIQVALRAKNDWIAAGGHVETRSSAEQKSESFLMQQAQRRFFEFIKVSSPHPDLPSPTAAMTETFQMILPALERLVRQVERTLEHYALTFSSEGIRRLLIAGQITANPAIVNYLSQHLELPTGVLNPFESSVFARQVKVPQSASERESFAPCIGLALSDNNLTPNFLFTHENKDRLERIRRNNMRILTTCLACLMILIGIFVWQERQLDHRRVELERLHQQLWAYNPIADQQILLAMFAKTKQNRQLAHTIVRRYTPLAAIQELSDITPANIRLISTEMNPSSDTKTAGPYTLMVEGVVFGSLVEFEATLSGFLFTLNKSPLFRKPSVQSKRVELYNEQEVLRFSVKMEMQ